MRLLSDNASAALAADITDSSNTLYVASGFGDLFPNPNAANGEFAVLTLEDTLGQKELVKLTSREGDAFTVIRGFEGTQPRAYAMDDRLELRVTASLFGEYEPKLVDYRDSARWNTVAGDTQFSFEVHDTNLELTLNGVDLDEVTDFTYDDTEITLAYPIEFESDVLEARTW